MRYMVIVKATAETEAVSVPRREDLEEMGAFNEQLVKAGVLLAAEGLHPSSTGVRIRYDAQGSPTVLDGPFAETKELIAGFWLLQVSSREEVVEWMRRAPFRDGEVEIRQVFEDEDFGDALTPELREREDRMRATVAEQHG